MKTELSYEEALKRFESYNDGDVMSIQDAMEIIPSIAKIHKDDDVEDNWDDFDAMIQDMKQHAKDNGQAIVMNDQPCLFRFGWLCKQTGKSWSMRIKQFRKYTEELKNSDDEFKQKKSLILTSAFLTQEGKYNLLAVINGT